LAVVVDSLINTLAARPGRAATKCGPYLCGVVFFVLLSCAFAPLAMAARAGSAAPRAWAPLDSSGTPVVWCFHGRVPDSRLVVVDKSRQRLLVLRYLGKLLLEYEYPCATGERPGPKSASSDEKTPEGIYFVTHRYHDKKITIFGDRALHINYPNPHDQIMGRHGNGIYIHGTNRAYKPRSSNGCLVMANPDLARVEPLLNEQFTPVILMGRMALPQASLQKDACEFLRTVKRSFKIVF